MSSDYDTFSVLHQVLYDSCGTFYEAANNYKKSIMLEQYDLCDVICFIGIIIA